MSGGWSSRRVAAISTPLPSSCAATSGPGEEAVETGELDEFLVSRIRALPFEYRAPLVLRDLEGLSNAEVAEALGLSVAAAKSRLHRARMTIRAELDAWERGS